MFRILSLAALGTFLLLPEAAQAQTGDAASTSSSASSASSSTTPYYIEGKWTYPGVDPISRVVEAGARGKMLIDCQVGTDGYLTSCDLVTVSAGGTDTANAIIRVFLTYTHVDPASVPGGIQPGARKKFTYSWQ